LVLVALLEGIKYFLECLEIVDVFEFSFILCSTLFCDCRWFDGFSTVQVDFFVKGSHIILQFVEVDLKFVNEHSGVLENGAKQVFPDELNLGK
jgi:hypothetical protein